MKREDIKEGMKVRILANAATSCELGEGNFWLDSMKELIGDVCEVTNTGEFAYRRNNVVEVLTTKGFNRWFHIGAIESAEAEVVYRVGQVFAFKDGERFILAHVDTDLMTLISLRDGNRWSKGFAHSHKNVPESVVKKIIGRMYENDFKLVFNSGDDMALGKAYVAPAPIIHEYRVLYTVEEKRSTSGTYASKADFNKMFPDAKFVEFIRS